MYEKTALKPYNEQKSHGEWPLLELTNATVKSKKHRGRLEDLLDVEDCGPLEARGTLSEVPDELKDIVRVRPAGRIYNTVLCLENVYVYSIEQLQDGTIKIWALGLSAWYSILPSEEYKSIFNISLEKAKLWFFLQDMYERYSSKGKNISGTVGQLYSQYAEKDPFCLNKRAAAGLFDKHHRYLLTRMCDAQADTAKWKRTPLFRDYVLKYSSEFAKIQESVVCAKGSNSNPTKKAALTSLPKRRSVSYRMFEHLQQYVSSHKLQPTDITKDRIVQFLYGGYVFGSYQRAARNIDVRAQDILNIMAVPPTPTPFNWVETPAYKELRAVTFADGVIMRRERLIKKTLKVDEDGGEETQESINVQPSITVQVPVGPPAAKTPVITPTDSDSDSGEENPPRERRSTKGTSSLRPSFTPAPFEPPSPSRSVDDDTLSAFLSRKRAFDMLVSPNAGPAAKNPRIVTNAPSPTSSLNLTTLRTAPASDSATWGSGLSRSRSTASQTVGPNRPGGHWECEIDGCKHSILEASNMENLKLIEEHYEEHGRFMKQAIEAIDGEISPSRPKHHVDNLLAKIEDMAKKWAMSKPAPIAALESGLPSLAPATSSSLAP